MPRYILRHLVSYAILGHQEMVPGAFQSGLRQAKGKASTFFGLDATSMANSIPESLDQQDGHQERRGKKGRAEAARWLVSGKAGGLQGSRGSQRLTFSHVTVTVALL